MKLFLIFVGCFLLTVYSQCSSHTTCTACVNDASRTCGFCGDTGVCSTGTKYGPTGAAWPCKGRWQYAWGSQVIQTKIGYPVNPIFADIFLYPADPTWLQINITRPYSDDTPIDLTVVQDCSGSMSPYVRSFATSIPKIMSELLANYRSSNFGYNGYIDKNIMNFADYHSGDYLFQFNTPGLDPWPGITQLSAVKSLSYQGYGADGCEGQLDAMAYTLACRSIMNWRNEARKFLFIATDQCFHQKGESAIGPYIGNWACQSNCYEEKYLEEFGYCVCNTRRPNYASSCSGCTQTNWVQSLWENYCYTINMTAFGATPASTTYTNFPQTCPFWARANDLKCHPDMTNTKRLTIADLPYRDRKWGITNDFVSTDDLKNMFLTYQTIPILGSINTGWTSPYWNPMFASWGFGMAADVGGYDGTNIVNAILTAIETAAGTIKLVAGETDTYATSITPNTGYVGVQILQTVSFNVTFRTSVNPILNRNLTFLALGYPQTTVQIWPYIPCMGCDGIPGTGGVAKLDKCGVCKGSDACVGCDGVPFSGKILDECGVCAGNNSCYGCDGILRSGKGLDACGICGGNNSTCTGCDNVTCAYTNATCTVARFDACGICRGNSSCVGCDGVVYNLTLVPNPPRVDKCGICGGNDACLGCDLVAYSGLVVDLCGICGGNNTCIGCDGKVYNTTNLPVFDVCGVCGGDNKTCTGCDGVNKVPPAVNDSCGVCGGNNTCIGCDGVPHSGRVFDVCGICGGDGKLCEGCDGLIYNLSKGEVPPINDLCGICGGNNTCIGCDGKIVDLLKQFPASVDKCGICLPSLDPSRDACVGCDGVIVDLRFQTPKLNDECQVCGGNNTCYGCDGVKYSGTVFDGCGICGGDNSTCIGCDNVPNSGTVFDKCGVCGGNNTCLIINNIAPPTLPISTVGIALIVTAAVIAVLVGVLTPILYFAYQRVVGGANWFLPSDMANKMANIKNNPLYKGKGPRVNPLAAR